MKFYTIQNNQILIADTEEALTRFYDTALPLPEDYKPGRYIVVDNELVIDPEYPIIEFEMAKAEKKKEALEKAYNYEKVGTFPFTAESVISGEPVEVNIEFKPDNLTKFQGYVLGYLTGTLTGKVTWLSAEDIPIYCTEEDCKSIIQLIAQYDSKLWEVAYVGYLREINDCHTAEEIWQIVIDYENELKEL